MTLYNYPTNNINIALINVRTKLAMVTYLDYEEIKFFHVQCREREQDHLNLNKQ